LGREVEACAQNSRNSPKAWRSQSRAYERSRQRLQVAREQLRQLKDEAVEGLEQQIKKGRNSLRRWLQRLEDGAKSAKVHVAVAGASEEGIACVSACEARALSCRQRPRRPVPSALRAEGFPEAEQLLEQATGLLRNARETLGDDPPTTSSSMRETPCGSHNCVRAQPRMCARKSNRSWPTPTAREYFGIDEAKAAKQASDGQTQAPCVKTEFAQ